jgi:iron complex transport system substrate-binding protein
MKTSAKLAVLVVALAAFSTPGLAQETMVVTDDTGREVEVPARPQRVVSQNDNRLTLPLLELGVPLVGSSGRIDAEGNPYMRAVPDLLGIDFDNADFEFVGLYNELDYEAIAALEPDLIVTMREDQVEQLSVIAPTLVIDPNQYPVKEGMARLAEVTGATDRYEELAAAYERKLETVSHFFTDPEDITVSVTFSFPAGQDVYVYNDLGALTVALDDLGLQLPPMARQMDGRSMAISPEMWTGIDADFVINFYGTTPEDGPDQVREGLNHYLEGWCDFLHACREDQYLFFPYASYGYSFGALGLNLDLLTTHIAGRDFVPFEESAR